MSRGLLEAGRWLAGAVATVLVSSFAVAAALAAAPGDPAAALAGPRATAAQVDAVRRQLDLDEPLVERWWHWLGSALHGDLGTSIVFRTDVTTLLGARLGTTVLLVVLAALLIVVFGVGLGALGGASRPFGPVVAALSAVGIAIPPFVAAQVLVAVFALSWGLFPATGAGDGLGDAIWHLVLPACALALAWAAYVAQITRTAVADEIGREHVETAVGRGLPPATIFRRHVLRNAAMPIAAIAALTIAGLIAGAVIVESAFGLDGVGSLLARSVAAKDYDVVQAISVLVVVAFVVVTGLLDLVQRRLDPRLADGSAR